MSEYSVKNISKLPMLFPEKRGGYTQESHIQTAAEATAEFIKAVMNERKSVIEETGLDEKSHAQNSSAERLL